MHPTVWPSGLRRWLQAPVRKGVGSNPTAVTFSDEAHILLENREHRLEEAEAAQLGTEPL